MSCIEERIETLYNFSRVVQKNTEYIPVYELMITGYAIKHDLPRKFVVDTLYYMSKGDK